MNGDGGGGGGGGGAILVVDDNRDVRMLLTWVLGSAGFRTVEADGGPQGLALLHEGELPVAVLVDVQMPDMDGWDTLAAIRADPATADLPVVMCTVKGRPLDVERGWELGCDGYLTKPFEIDDVTAEVRAVVARASEERVAARAAGLAEARDTLSRSAPSRAPLRQ